MKKIYLLIMVLAGLSANRLSAQTATITSPTSSSSITPGGSVSFKGARSNSGYTGSGNYTFAWSSSPSTGVSFSTQSSSTSSSSVSTNATFANVGSYAVTLTVTRGTTTATSSTTMVYVSNASTVSAGCSASSITLPTNTSTLNSSFTANGNTIGSYSWTESSSDAVPATMASASSSSTNVSFTVAGNYNFTVTANYTTQYGGTGQATANVSVTVNPGSTSAYPNNLFTIGSLGSSFAGFAIGSSQALSGMVINGMNSIGNITGTSSSAALGEDGAGYFYYLPNVSNTGTVTVYAMNHDGSGQTAVATAKINGSANTSLGFVRLGIDPSGYGWILASDGSSTLYLAKFKANQLNPTTITVVNSNVGISGTWYARNF